MRSLLGLKRTPQLSLMQVTQIGRTGVFILDPRPSLFVRYSLVCHTSNPISLRPVIPTFPSPYCKKAWHQGEKNYLKANLHQSLDHRPLLDPWCHCANMELHSPTSSDSPSTLLSVKYQKKSIFFWKRKKLPCHQQWWGACRACPACPGQAFKWNITNVVQCSKLLSHICIIALLKQILLFESTGEDNAIEKTSHSAPFFFGQLQNYLISKYFFNKRPEIWRWQRIWNIYSSIYRMLITVTWPMNFLTCTFNSSSLWQVTKWSWKYDQYKSRARLSAGIFYEFVPDFLHLFRDSIDGKFWRGLKTDGSIRNCKDSSLFFTALQQISIICMNRTNSLAAK